MEESEWAVEDGLRQRKRKLKDGGTESLAKKGGSLSGSVTSELLTIGAFTSQGQPRLVKVVEPLSLDL